ncbi:Oxysterol-binding protein-related protein 2 [Fragariocoptes setiger]|uniref:Oxysterol-binding protein n=1 Tax=Fragariocoptes setiger TaxID=1670756 RepID=A0ABQ7S915_9ACAR|nr:Oxysterol-binding protein-related protein 2 [Fragariocoptes setiger]
MSDNEAEYLGTDYDLSEAEDSYLTNYVNPECALLAYSRFNKIDKLRTLLEARRKKQITLDLNVKGSQKQNSGWSALHLASYFGNDQVVEQLLRFPRSEVDIDIQNNQGDTPLHKAAFTNRERVVQLLLSKQADIYIKNNDGQRPKDVTHSTEILRLIEAVEAADINKRKTELFSAVSAGDLKFIQSCYPNSYQISSNASADGSYVQSSPVIRSSCGPHLELRQITDDSGNTLLHIAALRNHKAVCLYLLENGYNAYQKNKHGQTCIDLATPQMQQVLLSVKPTDSQLDKLTRHRVSRFEGHLMRRVRFLGYKSCWVVLENGVFLVFNNKNDPMKKSYKYLESASINLDPSNEGVFQILFSDRTSVTLLVPKGSRLVGPTSSTSLSTHSRISTNSVPGTSVELERQKWVNAINDHIKFSTEFIRRGLKNLRRDDHDDIDDDSVDGNLSNLDQLLPLDTIKSIIQNAGAHYSILVRHTDELLTLMKDANLLEETSASPTTASSSGGKTTAGNPPSQPSRFLSRIRSSSTQAQPTNRLESGSRFYLQESQFASPEGLHDNWSSILFHLKLVTESANNTKMTMSQALSLMEHQEVIRQQRLQDQEEKCRVLEESLHMLARDHMELERSLSMNPIAGQSLRGARSMTTMSSITDYFDAFEDFDDEKTVTPTSIHSDDEIDEMVMMANSTIKTSSPKVVRRAMQSVDTNNKSTNFVQTPHVFINEPADDDQDKTDDDISICSALTIENEFENGEVVNDINASPRAITDVTPDTSNRSVVEYSKKTLRTKLPAPAPQGSMSLWNILKNCIGKDLSKITFPVVFNEPLTMLQRYSEFGEHVEFLEQADQNPDPTDRMELVCAYFLSGLAASAGRLTKPSNPILNETYEFHLDSPSGTKVIGVAEQVSHHPPISAFWSESPVHEIDMYLSPKIRFWGRSVEIDCQGGVWLRLKGQDELYTYPTLKSCVNNILIGKMWLEVYGAYEIVNHKNKMKLHLTLHNSGWFGKDAHRFDGYIVDAKGKKLRYLYGKWNEYLKSVDYDQMEKFVKLNPSWSQSQQSPKKQSVNSDHKTGPQGDASKISSDSSASTTSVGDIILVQSDSSESLEIPNSRTIWRIQKGIQAPEYYNFTPFTMTLNELTDELAKTLPHTDSRFRPDVRKLEHGDLDGAAAEKERLEEKQRAARKATKSKGEKDTALWFDEVDDQVTKKKRWVFNKKYWNAKIDAPTSFPDIF